MRISYIFVILMMAFVWQPLFADHELFISAPVEKPQDVSSAYRKYQEMNSIKIKVPTVVQIPFNQESLEYFSFAILDKTTNSFEPYYFRQETFGIPVELTAEGDTLSAKKMVDENLDTYTQFDLPDDSQGEMEILLSTREKVTSSALAVLLDDYVALPNSIEIKARQGDGRNVIVVARRKMNEQTIRFPKTTSDRWTIRLTFGQLLRIRELRLVQDGVKESSLSYLRFLAQPDHAYRIYFDSDRWSLPHVGEAGDLILDRDVLRVDPTEKLDNPAYQMADSDGDSFPDIRDNCVLFSNPYQEDLDDNGRGDVCDDFDKDGVLNMKDNCPNLPNFDQRDSDGDNLGDVCDGIESRFTERHKWVPWAGIGFAAIVLLVLFVYTAKSTFTQDKDQTTGA